MPFCPNSSEFLKGNARDITHMAVLIFRKFFDFKQKTYFRIGSEDQNDWIPKNCMHCIRVDLHNILYLLFLLCMQISKIKSTADFNYDSQKLG